MLRCPFNYLTGYDCPFCGVQRMCLAILHGDFVSAFFYNPVVFVLIPYFVIVFCGGVSKKAASWKITRICNSNKVVFTILGILCVWGVARNVI